MALKVKVKYNCTNDRTSCVPVYKSGNGSFAGDLFIILFVKFVEKMFIASPFTIFSLFPCFFILQIRGVNGTVVRKNSE